MGRRLRLKQSTQTKTYTWSAPTVQQLQAQAPNITLLEGSTGRMELTAARVAGIPLVPIAPIIGLPYVGDILASHMAPTGTVVTGRGGIGAFDGFIEWALPVTQSQPGAAKMGLLVALIVLVGAIGAALIALGWALSQIKAIVHAVVGFVHDNPVAAVGIAVVVGLGLIMFSGISKGKRNETS